MAKNKKTTESFDAPVDLPVDVNEEASLAMVKPELIHFFLYDVKPLPSAQVVEVKVARAPGKPPELKVKHPSLLREGEQLFWTSPDARLELRFSPALAPFSNAVFQVPRGAKVYSGVANGKFGPKQVVRYKLLATTTDGILLDQTIEFTVLHPKVEGKPKAAPAKAKSYRRK
ncbi:MAG: hypothetical protein HOP19_25130 [Acidobacteria bacterium]|nr:hypothetical protein [Acidobacteriota bacterium]